MKTIKFVSTFKNLPDQEKPREKLAKYGPESLQLWELLALLLRTGEKKGGKQEDVSQLSKRLLREAGFKGLFAQHEVGETKEMYDLYKSHAEVLVTVSEVARRLHGKFDQFDAGTPAQIIDRFKHLKTAKQEQCFVLHVDKKKRCVFQELVAMGTQDHVQVYPRDVLRSALWLGAEQIIVVHNHLGKAKPSKEDIAWTLRLTQGAWDLHQIKILDHIIIGKNDAFSFLEAGLV